MFHHCVNDVNIGDTCNTELQHSTVRLLNMETLIITQECKQHCEHDYIS